jgi:hypothetical protein
MLWSRQSRVPAFCQPSDIAINLASRSLARSAVWPRLFSSYEEFGTLEGRRVFGITKRQEGPLGLGASLVSTFPHLSLLVFPPHRRGAQCRAKHTCRGNRGLLCRMMQECHAELISYMRNASDPFYPQGAHERTLYDDENSKLYDFHGTVLHVGTMAEDRQVQRRKLLLSSSLDMIPESPEVLQSGDMKIAKATYGTTLEKLTDFALAACSAIEKKIQTSIGLWPTNDMCYRCSGTTTGGWDTLLQ